MKKLEKLTEKQILKLTEEEISLMIRLKKAEEGIKFTKMPKEPEYKEIQKPDVVLYKCDALSYGLRFDNKEILETLLNTLEEENLYITEYNYNNGNSEIKYAKQQKHDFIISKDIIYSKNVYDEISDVVKENKILENDYTSKLNEHNNNIEESKWIETEIYDAINIVRNKYYKLEDHVYRFKNEYMPLANNNEVIAMNFLVKAYTIDKETEKYVLANYKKD